MNIHITNLQYIYPKSNSPSLDGINLSISQGECIGLLGPNGAGKTTLMSLLAGLLSVQQGQILFDNMDSKFLTKKQCHQISLVPQDFAFYPLLSVWDNLVFFSSLYNLKDISYLEQLLEKVGLKEHRKKLAKYLSGGLKRRLNFAIGLINQPKLIFLDEITVGIDPKSRQFILDSVLKLKKQGVTVIYTSHYLQEIEQLCDRIVLLNQGKLIYQGNVQTILEQNEQQSLERFYLDYLNQVELC